MHTPEAQGLAAVMGRLERRIADLEARHNQDSNNSSKPPSSVPVGVKRKPPTPPSRRKRGGQPGRRKGGRPLAPPVKLRSSTDCKPVSCRWCSRPLGGVDPAPSSVVINALRQMPGPLLDCPLSARTTVFEGKRASKSKARADRCQGVGGAARALNSQPISPMTFTAAWKSASAYTRVVTRLAWPRMMRAISAP
jgi:hypothetical protein